MSWHELVGDLSGLASTTTKIFNVLGDDDASQITDNVPWYDTTKQHTVPSIEHRHQPHMPAHSQVMLECPGYHITKLLVTRPKPARCLPEIHLCLQCSSTSYSSTSTSAAGVEKVQALSLQASKWSASENAMWILRSRCTALTKLSSSSLPLVIGISNISWRVVSRDQTAQLGFLEFSLFCPWVPESWLWLWSTLNTYEVW